MSDDYELQTLLELRERERDSAEAEFASAMQELERQRQEVEQLEQKRRETEAARDERRRRLDAEQRDRVELAAMQRFDEYSRGVAIELEEQRATIAAARERLVARQGVADRAKKALVEAEKALRAVEKHRESWADEQEVLRRRKQSDALDEIASRRWQERNKS